MTKKHSDPVTHPAHYTKGAIQPADFIEDQSLGWHEGNAIKYIARARWKSEEVLDLEKAVEYLRRKIALLQK